MALLHIEQFDDEELKVELAPEETPTSPAAAPPADDAPPAGRSLYGTFFGSNNTNVMSNRPLSLKDQILFRMDLAAGNARLTLSAN